MKCANKTRGSLLYEDDGVTLIMIALLTVIFVAFTAMAVDIAHLFVVRNELHNAADAGALAGTRCLYDCMGSGVIPGSTVNLNANQFAFNAATSNTSEKVAVEVNWTPGQNTGSDVERGHWSFATRTFTPNDTLTPPALWDVENAVLDADPDFINAVRVTARRENTQANSFFARILGFMGFNVSAEAVAYIGFSGKLNPGEAEGPILICKESIVDINNRYNCTIARMINSSGNPATANTGAWTDFSQDPCTNPSAQVRNLVCSGGNPQPIIYGVGIGANNGQIQTAFDALGDCWINGLHWDSNNDGTPDSSLDIDNDGYPDRPWLMTLPVIDCNGIGGPITGCPVVVGAVNVGVIWMTSVIGSAGSDPQFRHVPRTMWNPNTQSNWVCADYSTAENRKACWNDFVNAFNLKNLTSQGDVPVTEADYAQKSIYFLPDCEPHEPSGLTGGQNYGILAKIPVLVH